MAKFYPSNLYNTEHKWHNFGRQSCSQCLGLWSSPVSWWYLQLRLRISYSYDIWYKASGVFWQLLHEWSYHTWTSKSITRRPHPISFSDPVCECVQTFSCSKIQLQVSYYTHIHVWFHSFESWLGIIHPIQNRKWILSSQPKVVLLPMIVHEARAEVNHCDGKTGKSPLILAAGVGADNVCQLLLDSKALVDGEKLFVTLAGWWGWWGLRGYPPFLPPKRGSILIGVRLFLSLSRIWGNVTSQNSSFSSWDFLVASFPCGCQSSVWIQSGDRWNAKHGKWNMVGCNMTLAYSSYVITECICFMFPN